jgi:hypothetical protein
MLPVLFEHSFLAIHTYPLMMGIAWGLGISLSFPFFEKLTNHKKLIQIQNQNNSFDAEKIREHALQFSSDAVRDQLQSLFENYFDQHE